MTDFTVGGRAAAEYVRGALYGLAAVSIWSGWIVVARLGLHSSLTPWDIAALRFGVAGCCCCLMSAQGSCLKRLGWIGLGGDRARRRRSGAARECRPDVRARSACRRFVSRGHAAGGSASCRGLLHERFTAAKRSDSC